MKPRTITEERALQISNNVSEEWNDHGDTSFATKAELCDTIWWLNGWHMKEFNRKQSALLEIMTMALVASHPDQSTESDKKPAP